MNLFRSEEHARNWASFDPAAENNLTPLSNYLERFNGVQFRERGRSDYISWRAARQ